MLTKDSINFIKRIPGLDAEIKGNNQSDTSKFYKLSVEGRRVSIEDLKGIQLD